VSELLHVIAEQRADSERNRAQIDELLAAASESRRTTDALRSELTAARVAIAHFEGSVTWQIFQRTRRALFAAAGGDDSRPVQLLQAGLRGLGRMLRLDKGSR
jgi:hypothetical protein